MVHDKNENKHKSKATGLLIAFIILISLCVWAVESQAQETESILIVQEPDSTQLFQEFKADWDTTHVTTYYTLYTELIAGRDTLYITEGNIIFSGYRHELNQITSGYSIVNRNNLYDRRTFQLTETKIQPIRIENYVAWLYKQLSTNN